MFKSNLFHKSSPSNIVNAKGPNAKDQLYSLVSGQYWTVLNTSALKICSNDKDLCHRVNALKHAIQTYGPDSKELPDLRQNKGNAKGAVFHGHANNSNGVTYVLEWAIVDKNKKIIALTRFDTHENFIFRKEPLTQDEISKILSSSENVKIMNFIPKKIQEAKDKVLRIENNYKKIQ